MDKVSSPAANPVVVVCLWWTLEFPWPLGWSGVMASGFKCTRLKFNPRCWTVSSVREGQFMAVCCVFAGAACLWPPHLRFSIDGTSIFFRGYDSPARNLKDKKPSNLRESRVRKGSIHNPLQSGNDQKRGRTCPAWMND